jgi:hypothetical protein
MLTSHQQTIIAHLDTHGPSSYRDLLEATRFDIYDLEMDCAILWSSHHIARITTEDGSIRYWVHPKLGRVLKLRHDLYPTLDYPGWCKGDLVEVQGVDPNGQIVVFLEGNSGAVNRFAATDLEWMSEIAGNEAVLALFPDVVERILG